MNFILLILLLAMNFPTKLKLGQLKTDKIYLRKALVKVLLVSFR